MSSPPNARPTLAKRPAPPPRPGWVGPLFRWELVRLARRGQDARARFLLAFTLLVVLTLLAAAWFSNVPTVELFTGTARIMTLQESANFAATFALTFLLTQLAVLVLLTPAYAAGGIAEEKERQTLPFLLVSDLRDREIVFGKFLGRLVFLLGVTAAGLPVLALTLLYGGVSLKLLLMGYLLTGTTVTLLAAIGVAAAAYAESFRGALFRAYGLSALHVCAGCGLHPMLSPFAVVWWLSLLEGVSFGGFLTLGLGYAAAQLAVAAVAVGMAVSAVRKARATLGASRRPVPKPAETRDEDDGDEPRLPKRRARVPEAILNRPPVDDDDPFLWKERHVLGVRRDADDDSIRGLLVAVGAVVALLVGFFAVIAFVALLAGGGSRGSLRVAERLFVLGGSAGLFTYLVVVGAAACSTICRERQRLTLESLLTIPVDRRAILGPKWRVCLTKGWWWGVPSAACVALGLLVAAPAAGPPAVAYLAAAVPAAASYGLWLSIRCHTPTRAILWFLPAAGALTLFPVVTWVAAAWDQPAAAAVMLAAGGLAAAAAGVVVWRRAAAAFEAEGRG